MKILQRTFQFIKEPKLYLTLIQEQQYKIVALGPTFYFQRKILGELIS